MNKLSEIQSKVKAPKGQFNSFGKYKYRSCEDIVESVKPVINPMGFALTLSDEVVLVGDRVYVKATATISDGQEVYSSTAWAREEDAKKGMDAAQITGAASSYARKYALNGLFAIDDTKDADTTNTHGKDQTDTTEDIKDVPDEQERDILRKLVYGSDLNEDEREQAFTRIEMLTNYTDYQKIQYRLEQRQLPIDQVPNPSQTDIKRAINGKLKKENA
jgi:hypothetical protein